jgi:hypothetical protein
VAGLAHPALHINGVPADFAGGIILDSEANGRGPLRELIHPKEALSGALAWRPDACAVVAVLDPVHSGFMDEHSDGAGLLLDPDLRGCSLAFRGRTPGMPEGHSAAHVFGSAM